jgi:curli biogenesis system outer membrane secretion channel CsgG
MFGMPLRAITQGKHLLDHDGEVMKQIKTAILILLFSSVCLEGQQTATSPQTTTSAQTATKHRVAILNFTHSKVLVSSEAIFGTNEEVGQNFSDMLAERLSADGVFRVIDRSAVNRALSTPMTISTENNHYTGGIPNINNREDEGTPNVSRIGVLLDVNEIIQMFQADAIITGEITSFGRDEDKKDNLISALRRRIKKEPPTDRKAVVGVTARMIDLNTGETLAATKIMAESQHSSPNLLVARGFKGNVTTMLSRNFSKTVMGEAVQQAVDQLARTFEQKAPPTVVTNPAQISGVVADVSGTDITINVGAVSGVHVGDTMYVSRTTRKIKDPTTGNTLRPVDDTVGQITITSVKSFFSIGTFTASNSGGTAAVNDVVRNVP